MFSINAVYYPSYIPPEDTSLNPVAIRPKFGQKSKGTWIEWNDTSRGTSFFYTVKNFKDKMGNELSEEAILKGVIPNQITCYLNNGKNLSLVLMTKAIFDQFVKDTIDLTFNDDQSVQHYFLTKNFSD